MPEHRYFLKTSNLNMYNHKEKHFFIEKSKCNGMRCEQSWHGSQGGKGHACLAQNKLKGKMWEDKVKK